LIWFRERRSDLLCSVGSACLSLLFR
jgi:hypothetical protein